MKRIKGRRPNGKLANGSKSESSSRKPRVLYDHELPESSSESPSADGTSADAFNRAIDREAMRRAATPDFSFLDSDYDELGPADYRMLRRLTRVERRAFCACGPLNLWETDAAYFIGRKVAKLVVKERKKWPRGIPIGEALRILKIEEGTLSSQISRATAKLKAPLNKKQRQPQPRVGVSRVPIPATAEASITPPTPISLTEQRGKDYATITP